MTRNLLIASFIPSEQLDWLLARLKTHFDIDKEDTFIFSVEDEGSPQLMVTFKFTINIDEKFNLKKLYPTKIILIHKRGNAFYTINGMNKLIELENSDKVGNLDYKSYKIDWSKYQNKLLLYSNHKLNISTIKRVF